MRLLRPDTITDIQSESWPPSPSPHPPSLDDDNNSTEDELDMPPLLREEDPLTYFLTPATPKDEEDLEFDFDFDAGIEDSSRPRDIIRSVSPSTLDGLKKYKPKRKSQVPDCAILDDDDDYDDEDDEDYIRFGPSKSQQLSYDDYLAERPRLTASMLVGREEGLLSPASFHVGSPRGRPARRFAPPPRFPRHAFGERKTRSLPALHRRHSWREPSPDVWSIEEEPEKETMSEMGLSVEDLEEFYYPGEGGRKKMSKKTQPIDIPAAKPKKKRVRFVLPVKE